jgi:two-component system, NtrC family, sensor kinase
MRRILVGSLKKWQYNVVEAEHGAQAWDRFQQEHFPLVLTDWMMPEMDGLELTKRIRASVSAGYTYIILLTAKSEKEDLVQAMEAGADDFLIKPCNVDELRVRVREGERIIRLEQTLAEQNRQLREAQAALVQSEKLLSVAQLAAGMAHEINNPISYVSNNLEVLRRTVPSLIDVLTKYRSAGDLLASLRTDLADELGTLKDASDLDWVQENLPRLLGSSLEGLRRVRDIVNNLRDFARLDNAELGEMDLNAALRSTAEVLAHEMDARRVTAELRLQEDLPPVLCRPAKVHQVLYNLLLNAAQASQANGRIFLRTSVDADAVIVEVEDHGCGIEATHLPRIFEPFFTTKPVGRGTGLGLAISYGIVRDHGGTIDVESAINRGSTFRVRLPLHPPGD